MRDHQTTWIIRLYALFASASSTFLAPFKKLSNWEGGGVGVRKKCVQSGMKFARHRDDDDGRKTKKKEKKKKFLEPLHINMHLRMYIYTQSIRNEHIFCESNME